MKLNELIYEESLLNKLKNITKEKITSSFDENYSPIIKKYYSRLPKILQQDFDIHMEAWKKKNLNSTKNILLYKRMQNEYNEEALMKIAEIYREHLKSKTPESHMKRIRKIRSEY